MVNIPHHKTLVSIGLDGLKITILMLVIRKALEHQKKFEDEELKALSSENPCQTEEELALALDVAKASVSKRLKKMGSEWSESYRIGYH